MSQCLRCNKPCEATAVFCDMCRREVQSQLQQEEQREMVTSRRGDDEHLLFSMEGELQETPIEERATSAYPFTMLARTPEVEQVAVPNVSDVANIVEQALQRLNQAAQRIEEVEQNGRRVPRASRLAPLRDISADIRRESTPMPRAPQELASSNEQGEDLGRRLPDLWPWLQDTDSEEAEGEQRVWENHTDPLMSRHFPNSTESARIEAEDIQRAIADGLVPPPPTPPHPRHTGPKRTRTRIRLAFVLLVLLAVVALVIDGGLALVALMHPHHTDTPSSGVPMLTLSFNVATVGEVLSVQLSHFSASSQVYLTRDIEETIQTINNLPMIIVDATGAAETKIVIDDKWGAGFHRVEAEDLKTHYTASAVLHINGSGPTPPSHLLVDSNSLDMGAASEGTNTIRTLALYNSGNGPISWSASSNQPWLILSPSGGTFSQDQMVTVGVERSGLKPKDYSGTITISSNVTPSISIPVKMTVRPLPTNAGAVLQVTPVVLSFTAIDGGANPLNQTLTISNPGTLPLNWSLTSTTPTNYQNAFLGALASQQNWLNTDQTSGTVQPGTTNTIQVSVQSQNLLPNVYTDTLTFTGDSGTYNNPQTISVSLTVQPRCSLHLGSGVLLFNAIAGKANPSSQALSLSAIGSCGGIVGWQATPSASWLTLSQTSGQLKGTTAATIGIGVNTSGLAPNTYSGSINFVTGQSSQTQAVQLIVENPPPPSLPIIGATPLTLNFSAIQGPASALTQNVSITNSGGSTLNWHTTVNSLTQNWISVSPTGGMVAPGQVQQMTVTVTSSQLVPTTYSAQIMLSGTDANGKSAGGSPQTVTVNLTVSAPCTLAPPSSSALTFTGIQGESDPSPQLVSIMAAGNCGSALNWKASAIGNTFAIILSPSNGTLQPSGQSTSISVGPSVAGLKPGTYSTSVSITATDASGAPVPGSPQSFMVTLTVQQPCTLQINPVSLSFAALQGQTPPATQTLAISEVGACAQPVSWSITRDAGSSAWLTLSAASGTSNGSVMIGVNSVSLLAGAYTGTLTISATGSGGTTVLGSPLTLIVSLTVTVPNFSVSGAVLACSDPTCTTSKPLAKATVTLLTATGTVAIVTADASGNFIFPKVPLGTAYTISVSGMDSTGKTYTGTLTPVSVTANVTGLTIQAF